MLETRQATRLGWMLFWLHTAAALLVAAFGVLSLWLLETHWQKWLVVAGSALLVVLLFTVGRFCRQLALGAPAPERRDRRSFCLSSLLADAYWRRVRD